MKKNLAIIIPAYKIDFLKDALDSISQQTCKNFTVYVGDDNSPYNLENIVDKYSHKIDIIYHRFTTNLGSKNLVLQWERCIELSKDEEWIWLFSDDDIMGKRCVELFYAEIEKSNYDIYHFDIKEINENGIETGKESKYPEITSSYYLYKNKMSGKIISMVVENIFSRKIYLQCNKFEQFDLAWGSDTATWSKFAYQKGMKTIHNDYVYWRKSSLNITPSKDSSIIERKLNSLINFFEWSLSFFKSIPQWKLKIINTWAYIIRMKNLSPHIVNNEFLNTNISRFVKLHKIYYIKIIIKIIIIASKKYYGSRYCKV